MSNVHPHGELHNPDTAYEHSDINVRAIVAFVIALIAITLVIQAAMYGIFAVFNRIETTADAPVSPLAAPANELPPEPRLQTAPWTDLKTLRAEEFSYLHSYGWVDKQAGVVRMPIEKSKALLLQKGLPARPGPTDAAEGTRVAATGESSGGRNLPAGGADKSSPPAGAQGASGAQGAPAAPKKPGGGL